MVATQDVPSADLYDRGMALIRDEAYQEALVVAKQLEAKRYTGAYEVGGLAHAGLGDLVAAVAYLELGVECSSDVWLNWQLLGNYRSDLERYDEAAAAYEQALTCPEVEVSSVCLNQATLAWRRGEAESGLAFLERVQDPALALRAANVRVGLLLRLGQHEAAEGRCEDALAAWDGEPGVDGPILAFLLDGLASARRAGGAPKERVLDAVLTGLGWDASNADLLWTLRDVEAARAEDTRYFNLLLLGADARANADGFYIRFEVAARTPAEALDHARFVEQTVGFDSLEIEDVEDLGGRSDLPMGVYQRHGRAWFDEDE